MVAISRKKALRPIRSAQPVQETASRGLEPMARGLDGPKTADQLTTEERANTMAWFDACRDLLNSQIGAIVKALEDAHPDDRDGLLQRKSELEDQRTRLAQQQEAFFDRNELALNPPDAGDIQRTKDISAQMDDLIRSQKKAEAVAALAGELADLVQKVGVDA